MDGIGRACKVNIRVESKGKDLVLKLLEEERVEAKESYMVRVVSIKVG